MTTLLISAFAVGALHALAPDHWFPFVAIAKAEDWTRRKLAWVVLLAGTLHVAAAFLIGLAGIALGVSLNQIARLDDSRAGLFSFLLIGFGLTYFIFAVKALGSKRAAAGRKNFSAFRNFLLALMVLGPCEPVVPFLFLGAGGGWFSLAALFLIFLAATVGTMTVVTQSAVYGLSLPRVSPRLQAFSHVFAGVSIVLTGIFVRVFGL